MTQTEWENGKELTIHNATKEQLKFMVKDRDNRITELQKELEKAKAAETKDKHGFSAVDMSDFV